ncbi:MAG: hypothetical protein ACOY90_05410 [Candidatus Zhuqueibacterota bacterium]
MIPLSLNAWMAYALLILSIVFSLTAHRLYCLDVWREGMPRRIRLLFLPIRYRILSWMFHALALVCWIGVLSRFELSYAFPLSGLGYIVISIYSVYRIKLNFSFVEFMGIVCIVAGLFFMVI